MPIIPRSSATLPWDMTAIRPKSLPRPGAYAGTFGANYCRDAAFDTFAESENHSEHRNDLASLAGAVRFLTSSETSDGHSLDEGVVKRVTGQSPGTGRHIDSTFLYEFKLRFQSN